MSFIVFLLDVQSKILNRLAKKPTLMASPTPDPQPSLIDPLPRFGPSGFLT
jgi:hypothetical protein